MIHKQAFIYGIMNTTIFIPYFIFIAMGDHYSTTLGGWLPLLLFYSFKYTGTYLLNIIGTRTQSRDLLTRLLLLSVIACCSGVLAPLSPYWLELSAVLLGLSSSLLLSLYTTIRYHEREEHHHGMSAKHYVWAFLYVILLMILLVLTLTSIYPHMAFMIYGAALLICYLGLRELPHYEVEVRTGLTLNRYSLLAFVSLSVLLFAAKGIRQTSYLSFTELMFIGTGITAAVLLLMLRKHKVMLKLSPGIRYFAFMHGMTMNFYVLYGTFYALSRYGKPFLMYGVYLPYFAGNILSLLFGGIVLRKLTRHSLLPLLVSGCLSGLLLCLVPHALPLGGVIVGFCASRLGILLNRWSYGFSSDQKDSSIVTRSRWSMLGSAVGQISLVTLLLSIALLWHLPVHDTIVDISGQGLLHSQSLIRTVQAGGVVMAISISALFGYGFWKYRASLN
ncbi:hypothetical protein FLT15_13655 [Paenibacillus thiaminolyticus]|uniref:transmembrane-type terpene cyclase n=1 Tax=Paenibacillus thiaminolyticus TaxID=49283 RepID=UPI001162A432|nr:hypothetical protein [Paenibacillus thiaminolyticus]NGP59360.1 hypothetical protein [Paenibacillus thiaminolyticus]